MSNSYKKISPNAGQFIPEGVRDNAINFEKLLTHYYQWAESDGGFLQESKELYNSFSYDTASDDYMPIFKDTILRLFPDKHKTITRHLLKFSKDFYSERGSPESYDFLFKALWDEEINITYPSDNILRSSDGEWESNILMKISIVDFDIIGKTVKGVDSNAVGLISDIFYQNEDFIEIILENISKDFEIDETLEFFNNTLKENVIGYARTIGAINGYKIIDTGQGYLSNKIIQIDNNNPGDGTGLSIKILSTDSVTGKILSLEIINSGQDYLYDLPKLDLEDIYLFDTSLAVKRPAVIELLYNANYTQYGYYSKNKSFLSDDFKLRDGYFYQEYSYVIETNLDFITFNVPVMDLVHPAGMQMFYKKLNKMIPTVIELNSTSIITAESFIDKDPDAKYVSPVLYPVAGSDFIAGSIVAISSPEASANRVHVGDITYINDTILINDTAEYNDIIIEDREEIDYLESYQSGKIKYSIDKYTK